MKQAMRPHTLARIAMRHVVVTHKPVVAKMTNISNYHRPMRASVSVLGILVIRQAISPRRFFGGPKATPRKAFVLYVGFDAFHEFT
jgi:hypothetical protein